MTELLEETSKTSKYINDQGFNLVEIWPFHWPQLEKKKPSGQKLIEHKFQHPFDNHKNLTESQILAAIRNKSLFVVVECDIQVPHQVRPKFSELCPIFKDIDISPEDIGEYM